MDLALGFYTDSLRDITAWPVLSGQMREVFGWDRILLLHLDKAHCYHLPALYILLA